MNVDQNIGKCPCLNAILAIGYKMRSTFRFLGVQWGLKGVLGGFKEISGVVLNDDQIYLYAHV